jgi:hypothetical protein
VAFAALLDACVLYPPSLRDALLSLALTDLFRARWTSRIQNEWIEVVTRTKPQLAEALQQTRQIMEVAVRDTEVSGYDDLVHALKLPDPNDPTCPGGGDRGEGGRDCYREPHAFPAGGSGAIQDCGAAPRRVHCPRPDVGAAGCAGGDQRNAGAAAKSAVCTSGG